MDPAEWLALFRRFASVEELYVSEPLGPHVALALAGAAGQAEMLPALRSLFFKEPQEFASSQETIEPFLAARRLSNPIATHHWERQLP